MDVKLSKNAEKDLSKLDRQTAESLSDFLENHIAKLENPRSEGRALAGKWRGLWRYRYRDYRIICDIMDARIIIAVIRIGHRGDVYR